MNTNSPSNIFGGLRSFRSESNDSRQRKELSPRDAEIFCAALGLESSDESWFDVYMDMDNPLGPMGETSIGNC